MTSAPARSRPGPFNAASSNRVGGPGEFGGAGNVDHMRFDRQNIPVHQEEGAQDKICFPGIDREAGGRQLVRSRRVSKLMSVSGWTEFWERRETIVRATCQGRKSRPARAEKRCSGRVSESDAVRRTVLVVTPDKCPEKCSIEFARYRDTSRTASPGTNRRSLSR